MSMHTAYTLAAHAVRARYADQRPELLAGLDALTGRDVHVIKGVHDSAQKVLDCLSVPHRMGASFTPKDAAIVFGNCGWRATSPAAVAEWVDGGGWLITSDWSLTVVGQAFPNTIRPLKGRQSGDDVVGMEPAADSAFADVVVLGCDPQWWLEAASYPIEVLDDNAVQIEAASHELLARFGAPAVAARFEWGAGQVFHVISHFWLKKTRQADARHSGSAADFMRIGMRLSDDRIAEVFAAAKVRQAQVNFASLQSAVTSTELIARLCIDACADRRGVTPANTDAAPLAVPKRSLWQWIFG